jgi:cytochrome P450
MTIEVKKISLWDTLRLQLFVSIPAFFLGLVAGNRWVVSYVSRHGAGRATMHFFRDLRDKYRCDHLWAWFPGWFPVRRTLLVLAPETIEAVLLSDANAADPFLKKRALSRFIPDALVISSGDEWRHRRGFNENVLATGKPHEDRETFRRIASREVEELTGERPGELRWADFQSLGERISHQVILGTGEIKPELTAQLARMVRWSNVLLRHGPSFAAFYEHIERFLTRKEPASTACLRHDSSALLESGSAGETTRVPAQIGFWFFVLKDALELHVARTLALIASHPEVQTKARQEVRAAGTLTVEAIEGLHYLEACLREQLRLWTPVPMLLRRATKAFSLRDEIPIEAEQQILIHAGFYHRDARYFGAYADTFLPEATDYEFPTVYFFSAHRQSCAGRTLATFLLKATLASLLSRLRFELVAPAIEPGRIPYLYDHFSVGLRTIPEA